MATAAHQGFDDPRWLTYRQAQEKGWQVRQGEKGTQIEYWQFDDRTGAKQDLTQDGKDPGPDAPGDAQPRQAPVHRVYTVFNAQQMDGVPAYQPKPTRGWQIVETGEQILQNSGATIRHDQNDSAFYSRSLDPIHLLAKEAFHSAADYYGTALHELAHWSGHPTRLNRETLTETYRFGHPLYAKEELRAELTSVFLAAERGIPHNPEQHASYVGAWVKVLQNDKHEIFRAAKDAHTAANFLLGLEQAKTRENASPSQIRRETAEPVAAYEKGTGTVTLVEKETATEDRTPAPTRGAQSPEGRALIQAETEKMLDGEGNGRRPPSEGELQHSLVEAEKLAKGHLGDCSRLYAADTESGRYRGELLAETEHHLVQKISARSAAAHPKHLLPQSLTPGQTVAIHYSNTQVQTKPFQARDKAQALAR